MPTCSSASQRELPVLGVGRRAEADAVVAAHQHDVDDLERKVVVDRVALRHVAEAQAGRDA